MDIKKIIMFLLKKLENLTHHILVKIDSEVNTSEEGDNSPSQYVRKFILEHGIHPEAASVIPYTNGLGIDIGCGGNKTLPNVIGVDITPKGQKGLWGNQRGVVSEADVCASGDCLPFKSNEFDFIIARHNLEHYQDIIKTLAEWFRVLKVGGYLCIVLPDDTELDTIHLDPTHKHVFMPESFRRLIENLGGFEIIKIEVCIPRWSFVCILKKRDDKSGKIF